MQYKVQHEQYNYHNSWPEVNIRPQMAAHTHKWATIGKKDSAHLQYKARKTHHCKWQEHQAVDDDIGPHSIHNPNVYALHTHAPRNQHLSQRQNP